MGLVATLSICFSLDIRCCKSWSWWGSEPVVVYVDGGGENHLWRVGDGLTPFFRSGRPRDFGQWALL